MKRTLRQNSAAHLFARRLAQALIDHGRDDMRTVIKVPIRPTEQNVWSEIVHPVMKALYPDKESTTELSTAEMAALAEQLEHLVADRLEIDLAWPSEENMRQEFLAERGEPDFICRRK